MDETYLLNVTEEEMLEALMQVVLPEEYQNIYDGPGAFSKRDLMDKAQIGNDAATEYLDEAVEAGKLVQVWERRKNTLGKLRSPSQAWVLREVYEQWKLEQGND